ncbi:two-component system sensor histidine kinase NtrB [Desulfofalx alkaliphila]|uniref:two-component system sensor histidine kinase NtrB n=1 Tax=Desulfofalx alkaliphila TaxID=105483 RepID=UPI00068A6FB9|nr:ATP-binding protein [Desulfofalx alkaliphila]
MLKRNDTIIIFGLLAAIIAIDFANHLNLFKTYSISFTPLTFLKVFFSTLCILVLLLLYRRRQSIKINQLVHDVKINKTILWQVVNRLPVAVIAVDMHGKVMVCNKTAKKVFNCHTGCDDISSWVENCPGNLLRHTISTGKGVYNYEYFLKNDGDYKKILLNTEIIKGIKDEHLGAVLTAHDITEHQQVMQQMQQSEKMAMISELAAGVAHEIKNPLTTSRGLLQLLNLRFEEGDQARLHIKVALDSLDKINAIIQELVLLSQPNKPELTINQLEKVLDEVSVLIDSEAAYNKVAVERIYQPNLPLAVMDVNQIKQVFINIATNAIQAMPQGGKLTITVEYNDKEKEYIISFKDNGVGIAEEDLKKIFNPFFTTKEHSTGLGLTVSYQLIKHHGGDIKVKSAENKGTVFTVLLPLLNNGQRAS